MTLDGTKTNTASTKMDLSRIIVIVIVSISIVIVSISIKVPSQVTSIPGTSQHCSECVLSCGALNFSPCVRIRLVAPLAASRIVFIGLGACLSRVSGREAS